MAKLTCSECKVVYTEEADIQLAKEMQKDYEKRCKQHNTIPKGIAPCPNLFCKGELVLTA